MGRRAHVAAVVMDTGTRIIKALPRRWVDRLERRFFYALFQVTRVENDDYGQVVVPPPGDGRPKESNQVVEN